MSKRPISLDLKDHIARLTLERPEVHNVVNEPMLDHWEAIMDRIEASDQVRVVLLTGSGSKTFCAGGDLRWFARLNKPEDVRAMSERVQAILNRLFRGSIPVIGVINGSAYGGGCEVLTACHYRIAADDVGFQFRQSAMGVVTGWGGGLRLLQQIGRGPAMELLLAGNRIDAARALQVGLIERVVPRDRLWDEARQMAEQIASRSPDSIGAFLKLARFEGDQEEVIEKETELFVSCWQGPWFRNAVNQFLEKSKKES